MLSGYYRQYYQTFQQALDQLQVSVAIANPDPAVLQTMFLETQQLFQQQIMGLNVASLHSADMLKVQSIQTEINRQLRLLGVDVMFLQTARQALTVQKRQAQMGDRIGTLIGYCEVLLKDNE